MPPPLSATMSAEWTPEWLDAQYNNRARVPQAMEHLQRWAVQSADARAQLAATGQAELDVPYMADPHLAAASQTLDIFTPPAHVSPPPGGWPVLVFIHGGYWRALDKADHSFLAPTWVNALAGKGAVVVIPNYALCPAVSVSTITAQMQQAVAWVWRNIPKHGGNPQRITVAGHSAGGHLVGMLLATSVARWQGLGVAAEVATGTVPVQHGVSISGLFDLEPIRQTPFLADLGLTPEEAQAQSPVRHPHVGGVLTAVVGVDESGEFLRQNTLLQQAWGEAVVPVAEVLPGLNHFSVLEELSCPGGRLATQVANCLAGEGV